MAGYQSEAELENLLINQLKDLGYEYVELNSEKDVYANLRNQLEKHNSVTFSDREFLSILNQLNKGGGFERAKILRDKIKLDRDDGTTTYIELLNTHKWCQNIYQVTNQVTQIDKYKNRYDVTILVNGLPLCQIELKRRGVELKEAFNQIKRYQKHSFGAGYGLYRYVQVFVITNGVNTKYYTQGAQDFKFSFYWAKEDNSKITNIDEFADEFLEPCKLSKIIARYIVLHESNKSLMVLRPYQIYAVEKIVDKVTNSNEGGYIWHTTGSGKTLTSFKASQIISGMGDVDRVVFVVDRKDLDYQTTKEFNAFSNGSVDGTDNTNRLVEQFEDINNDTKLIVTTIQKLNNAISKQSYLKRMDKVKDNKIAFIFDECHRSQFGQTHNSIVSYFGNCQLFGFTGTPIFSENSSSNELGKRTTKDLFGQCLHKYVISDAIDDGNVLKFVVEYVGRYKHKETSKNLLDIDVEGVDTAELMESSKRLGPIVDYIIANHERKTHSRKFNSIMAVSSVKALTKYYDLFRSRIEADQTDLKIATIFSYGANEEGDLESSGIGEAQFELSNDIKYVHSREKLDEYISHYNQMFGTNFSTQDSQSFYNYYRDLAKKVKDKQIDILLVVNMFLTGFDAKSLNTLYVDKNLRYHGLIQAYSRTNRILNELKSHGNIVSFRNLKNATDKAVELFSNKTPQETILMKPLEEYVEQFNSLLEKLREIAPTVDSVNHLHSDEDKHSFVKAFRELLKVKNILKTFADFEHELIDITNQEFEDYSSKYKDLYNDIKTSPEKVSILDDVDFELELLHRDEINLDYILNLLKNLLGQSGDKRESSIHEILQKVSSDVKLRNKKELIEKFINENLIHIQDSDLIESEFEMFMDEEKSAALSQFCDEEDLDEQKVSNLIYEYNYTNKEPKPEEIDAVMNEDLGFLARREKRKSVFQKITDFIDTFFVGG